MLAILAATLVPAKSGELRPFSYCLACDFRWLADAVLNIALFLPLGFAAAWGGRSFWKVSLAGALFSTLIELMQMVVPGRDPALRDILCNAAGAALGAAAAYRPRYWLEPSVRTAWLVGAAGSAIFAVIACTALLLAPADPRTPPTVEVVNGEAVLHYHSVANGIGLDQPEYDVGKMLADITRAPARVYVSRRWTGWCLRLDEVERCRIGPTLGRGWSALVYPAAITHRWADALIDVAWTALLFLPLGFWTTRRNLALSLGIAIVLLGAAPAVFRLVPTTIGEWVGASASIVVGFTIAAMIRRRLRT